MATFVYFDADLPFRSEWFKPYSVTLVTEKMMLPPEYGVSVPVKEVRIGHLQFSYLIAAKVIKRIGEHTFDIYLDGGPYYRILHMSSFALSSLNEGELDELASSGSTQEEDDLAVEAEYQERSRAIKEEHDFEMLRLQQMFPVLMEEHPDYQRRADRALARYNQSMKELNIEFGKEEGDE